MIDYRIGQVGNLQTSLDQANEREKEYKWLTAVKSYKKAASFTLKKKDYEKGGIIHQRIGYCLYRSALQAKSKKNFIARMQQAISAYQESNEFLEKVRGTNAQIHHGKAMNLYINSLLEEDSSTKQGHLDKCWELGREAVRLLEKTTDYVEIGKACNILLVFLIDRLGIEWKPKSREKIVEEGIEYGEKAITNFSKVKDVAQLSRAYILASYINRHGAFARGATSGEREERRTKALNYPKKGLELSESINDRYLIGLSSLHLGSAHLDILGSTGIQDAHLFEKALQCGLLTKNNLLIADALFGLEFASHWRVVVQEDPEKARKEYRKLCEYGEEAIRHYNLVGCNSGAAMAYNMMLNSIEEVSNMETSPRKRLQFIERRVEIGYKGLKLARLANSMVATSLMSSVLGTVLVIRARVEREPHQKTNLLKKALKHIEESISIQKTATALSSLEPIEGNLALAYWSLSLSQTELANIEESTEESKSMLKNAIENMQLVSEYWQLWIKSPWTRMEKPHLYFEGMIHMKKGKTLNQLYTITNEKKSLLEGIKAFEKSAEANDNAGLPSREAEAYWQIAKSYDQLADYSQSATNFSKASEMYTIAAEKMSQLGGFYMDYAIYMQAWSQIEKARISHAREDYSKATEYYRKAAILHESTRRWNHLNCNYYAWAQLEKGVDLSRKEQTQKAKERFQKATHLFKEAKKAIQRKLVHSESDVEQLELHNLIKTSDIRLEYCLGRILFEEARIFDKEGDHTSSSKKFGLAADIFEKIAVEVDSEHEQSELEFTTYLCRGWQNMALAEAEASPDHYSVASKLFQEARNHSTNEKTKKLVLGHSHFAKALEAGMRFEDDREMGSYSTATQHLESAASYYLKAGFKSASDFSKATQHLLDAYVYVDNAKKEDDLDKKAKYYLMAERVLQASVSSYMDARHPEKSEEAQRLLGTVRDERELATSLSEVFHAPIVRAGATATFSTPTMTQEKPVGLEKFEHADIEASISLSEIQARIGDDINLKIDIVNAGKGPALLMRIEEVLPKGFELSKKTEFYSMVKNQLDLNGKRLLPLKTEVITLSLKPIIKGNFNFKPRILYMDETGENRIYQLESLEIQVSKTLPGRLATGLKSLDGLLLGGIPEHYSVLLMSQSHNEKEKLIKSFISQGIKEKQTIFHVITRTDGSRALAEEFQSSYYLFLCNLQADKIIRDMPNVYKLKGVENLTQISIALSSALRRLPKTLTGPRRACIEIISDVLLQHHALQTRRWLNALIPELKAHGFTTLAVINPGMHPAQEVHAVLDLFDGEINIDESESKNFLRIKRMNDHRYLTKALDLQ
jgi:tetratricopeptide (TPR) repeat protein/KaiC/GvpD/RAD55 family RecA-like ATPase